MAFFAKLDTSSFRDLVMATKHVLRDAWRDNRGQFAVLILIALLSAMTPYALSGSQALLLNHLTVVYHVRIADVMLYELIVLIAVMYFVRTVIFGFSSFYGKYTSIARQQAYELRFTEKLAELDVATHEDREFKDQLQVLREHGESHAVSSFFSSVMAVGASVVSVITAASIVLIFDWRLFCLMLVASLPQLIIEARYGQGLWTIYQAKAEDRRQYIAMTHPSETAEGIKEMQIFQTFPYFFSRQKQLLEDFLGAQRRQEYLKLLLTFLSETFLVGAIVITLIVLVGRVVSGSLQVGTFVFAFGTVMSFQDAVSGFFLTIASQLTDARPVASFFDIMARSRRIRLPKNGVVIDRAAAPRIEFKNVSFAYPLQPDIPILKNFSLTIEPGERVAIVGVNGAGKSTLMKLLFRRYDPTEGSILINGVDLRAVDLDSWYGCLAFLGQDFTTYHVPVDDLISLGRLGPRDDNKIIQAATRSEADGFIRNYPQQYQQQIGGDFTDGIDPSVGQQQKLALARCFYREGSVAILDEPTAHVDAEAERNIFERLKQESDTGQTLIFISHRFSTVRIADRICVIKDGGVCELGSHNNLLAKKGVYATLFHMQAAGYK